MRFVIRYSVFPKAGNAPIRNGTPTAASAAAAPAAAATAAKTRVKNGGTESG